MIMRPAPPTKAVLVLALLGVLLSAAMSGYYFNFTCFEADTASSLFQARLLASGRLAADAPPDHGFSPSPHINIHGGRWYSKYPFGNALALALGELIGAPWLIPALATGASLLLLFFLVRQLHGPRLGLLAALLGLLSPATLGMGATMFSEPISRFFLALYLWALCRTLRGGGAGYAILSGFALGYAFNTRPLTAVAFGVVGAAWTLYELARSDQRLARLREMIGFGVAFGVLCAAWFGYNAHFTGDPLQSTHNVLQPLDRLGFGVRSEGHVTRLLQAREYTIGEAVKRTWRHTIPCISYNALGWGSYRPEQHGDTPSYSGAVITGLVVKGSGERSWVSLKLTGDEMGNGTTELQVNNVAVAEATPGPAPGRTGQGGRADIRLRLARRGDKYTASYRMSGQKQWVAAGTVTARLTPPLKVGLYTSVNTRTGALRVDFDYFRVRADNSKALVTDEFGAVGETVGPPWRWQGRPQSWTAADGGLLRVEAGVNQDLSPEEDSAATLFQTTRAKEFEVETRLMADWRQRSWWRRLPSPWAIPLLLPLLLMVLPLVHRSRSHTDVVFLALPVLCLGLYFFYHFAGSTWGFTPVNVRYYAECTLLGVLPLVARGMTIFYGWLRARLPRAAAPLAGVIALALLVNTAITHVAISAPYRSWNDVYQKLPLQVKQQDIHRAVIFLPLRLNAPLGDYPFVPLKKADVVYYRLGPNPAWRLDSSDWRKVYRQYFRGRKAYLYEHGALRPLEVPRDY